MFKFVLGIVVGTLITLAALNPTDAKNAASKSVDAIHKGYTVGAKVLNDSPSLEIPEIPKVTVSVPKGEMVPVVEVKN